MNKILIIGKKSRQPPSLEYKHPDGDEVIINLSPDELDRIHKQGADQAAAKDARGYGAVALCRDPGELVAILAEAHARSGPLDLLDIVDHGRPGLLTIGDDTLWSSEHGALTRGAELPTRIAPFMATNSRIRLLGCKTALREQGRAMLASLGLAFGRGIVVYGTIERVIEGHFEKGEFSQAQDLLFSSEAAVDCLAPTADIRSRNLRKIVNDQRDTQRNPIS